MYNIKKLINSEGTINMYDAIEGETIEEQIKRMVENKTPIPESVPPLFQERDAGVDALTDPRTDIWDLRVQSKEIIGKDNVVRGLDAKKKLEQEAAEAKERGDKGGSQQER